MKKRLLVAVLAACTSATLFSCTETVAPPEQKDPGVSSASARNPRLDMQALPPMEVDLSAQPGTITVGSIPFVEGVVADISITGLITLNSDDRAFPIHYNGSLDHAGVGVPYGTCLLDAKLYFSKIVSGALGGGPCLLPRTMADYSTRALIGGNITATRGPYPYTYNYCGAPCVYTATGSQHISIRPVAGDLTFKGSWSTQSGKVLFIPLSLSNPYIMVRFQEFTNPSGLTLKPLLRSWKQADDTLTGNRTNIMECPNGNWQANPASYPGLVCDIYVKESGIMTSVTRINGVQHTDSVTVYCADSIAMFNHDQVRQQMMRVFDAAGVPATPITSRKELAFFIVQDTTIPGTEPYVITLPAQADANQCNVGDIANTPHFSARPAGTKLLAWGHVHVVPLGAPTVCLDAAGNAPRDSLGDIMIVTPLLGISYEDWEIARDRNLPTYPHYVGPVNHYVPTVDGDLWVIKPNGLPGSPVKFPANNLKWGKGQCAWPRHL